MHSLRCSGLEMKGSGTKAVIASVEVTAETCSIAMMNDVNQIQASDFLSLLTD